MKKPQSFTAGVDVSMMIYNSLSHLWLPVCIKAEDKLCLSKWSRDKLLAKSDILRNCSVIYLFFVSHLDNTNTKLHVEGLRWMRKMKHAILAYRVVQWRNKFDFCACDV